ncbi:hypothetical protein [Oryza sativa Japonica Group]|uniref:Uncharacterized protein P0702B09.18 n=1 Tax=Oryza sativa subsp. japonica TaxID=39947 RepID=Q94J75_ORYSJ|nr:hypothetical protein [Oryza sativa Japonica Group]
MAMHKLNCSTNHFLHAVATLVFTVHDPVVMALHVRRAALRSPVLPFRQWPPCRRGSAFTTCIGRAIHGATPPISPVAFGHIRSRLPITFRHRRSDRKRGRRLRDVLVVAIDLIATIDDLLSMRDPHLVFPSPHVFLLQC